MKRYVLFSGDRYHPAGGWDDFFNDYNSRKAAVESGINKNDDW